MTAATPPPPAAIALDLGTTVIKGAHVAPGGSLARTQIDLAPIPTGEGVIREVAPEAYVAVVEKVAARLLRDLPAATPVGVACQRSSFILWSRKSGVPVTPIISWQDRRAAAWCARHAADAELFRRITGLVFSPHYAGPKLAALQEDHPDLARALAAGDLLFGNLETWLLWRWTGGRVHETDPSMAARTGLMDPAAGRWSEPLCRLFQVGMEALPRLVVNAGRAHPLSIGGTLTASLADQSAGALAAGVAAPGTAYVNLGTGVFVLRRGTADERRPGYLTSLLDVTRSGEQHWALEGTVNGGAGALERAGGSGEAIQRPIDLPETDPHPDAFCLPDLAGVGAPHWHAALGPVFSPAAERLDVEGRRRVVLEGLLFRVVEILDGLFAPGSPARIRLSGGVARHPAVSSGLAQLVAGAPVEHLVEGEGGLLGVGRIAAGLEPDLGVGIVPAARGRAGGYLPAKRRRWQEWLGTILPAGGG